VAAGGTGEHFWVALVVLDQCPHPRRVALVSSRFWVPLVVLDQCQHAKPKHWWSTTSGTRTEPESA